MSGLAAAGVMVRLLGFKSAIGGFLKTVPAWAYIALAAIAVLLLGWHVHSGAEKRAYDAAFNDGYLIEWKRHQTDIASWRKASAAAVAKNLAEVRQIKASADAITEKHDAQIQTDAAHYRDAAAAYARLHPAPGPGTAAAGGDPGKGQLPAPANAAGRVDADPAFAFVPSDDLQRCADAYTVATGWQAWWKDQVAAWPKSGG